MRSIAYEQYGSPDVLQLKELEKPSIAGDEVLVKVHAASTNAGDWHLMRGEPFLMRLMGFGLLKPKNKVLGSDFAGTVVEAGANVADFEPGAEVFGVLSSAGYGAFSEFVSAPVKLVVEKPESCTFEQAAAVPTAATAALQALRDAGKIKEGQRVLVNGASGGVGTFAVQIAKALGAHVTGVCSGRNVDMVRSIGADVVIDYTKQDFTKGQERFDLIVDAAGHHSLRDIQRVLSDTGTYVFVGGKGFLKATIGGPLMSLFGKQKLRSVLTMPKKEDLVFLRDLLSKGQIKPVIDRSYALEEVPDALRYLEEGHAQGKVVITV